MIISIPVFMITLKWIQDFHLAFEPMGVYMNTICSNVPVPEECMGVLHKLNCESLSDIKIMSHK